MALPPSTALFFFYSKVGCGRTKKEAPRDRRDTEQKGQRYQGDIDECSSH